MNEIFCPHCFAELKNGICYKCGYVKMLNRDECYIHLVSFIPEANKEMKEYKEKINEYFKTNKLTLKN